MKNSKNDLSENEYCNILFQQFYYTALLYKRVPFCANTFMADQYRRAFLLYLITTRGSISTKKLIVRNKDSATFQRLLLNAYPDLEINEITHPE